MTQDQGPQPDGETPRPARLDQSPPHRPLFSRISVVWIVPILALIISLGVAWRTYSERGVLIEVTFADAAGLTPGQSVLKYRQVTVGKVEKVGFTPDLSKVVVSIRVDKEIASHIDKSAQFWVVRPQIGFSGISGLDTVLSGVFIEGMWGPDFAGPPPAQFAGLDKPPIGADQTKGTWVTLTVPDGGALIDGAPVLYRGIKVGEMRNIRLDEDGQGVLIDAYVQAPFNKELSSSTVFWDTSGFSVSLSASGVKLNVRSLSSLIQGGVEFNTIVSGGTPVMPNQHFHLFPDEATARDSIFSDSGAIPVSFSILLDGSVRGLQLGDAINFRGIKVGEVSNLQVQVDSAQNGARLVRQRVDFIVNPERMGLPHTADAPATLQFLQSEVGNGLRARVSSTGLLGGSLVVDLVNVPKSAPAHIDATAKPFPVIPSVDSDISDVSVAAQGLFARLSSLPIEKLVDSATNLLDQASRLIGNDQTQAVPGKVAGLLDDAHAILGSPDAQATPGAIHAALTSATDFFEALNKAGTVDAVGTAMTDASDAAQAVRDASAGVPQLVDTLNAFGKKANDLPLQQVTQNAADLVASLNKLAASPDTANLPTSLSDALKSLSEMLDDLRKGGVTQKLTDTMTAAQGAASSIDKASAQLPDLVARLDKVVSGVDTFLGSYGSHSPFNDETLATLRQLRAAASSIDALARTLQRNPQSLILGR